MDIDEIKALATQAENSCSLVNAGDFWSNPYLERTQKGDPKAPSIPALVWWLEHPSMGLSHVRFNEFEGVIEAELLPWNQSPHTWTDADTSFLLNTLQEITGGLVKNESYVLHALTVVAHKRKYDPLLDMLDSLPEWDGIKRADTLVIDFLGAEDTPYNRFATRHMLNGAVMRAYNPGCQYDECIVLSSQAQGIGKSTLARKLALSDRFFTDNLGSITSKDASENIQGIWVCEISELASIAKKSVTLESVKKFLSHREDRYRASYARFATTRKRRTIFVGTTNSTAFLADRTGNRRFFPIACHVNEPKLDIFSSDADNHIKQALAEVVSEYHEKGFLPLVIPDEIKSEADRVSESFTVADHKEGLISAWVDERKPGERVCILQVLDEVFDVPRSEASKPSNKALTNEISQILDLMPTLKRIGRVKHSKVYGQQRCWECKPNS